jgi:hypothetical protein
MIQFTVYTQLHVVHDPPSTFPSYIYRVTNFDHVVDIVGQTNSFIGKIKFPLSLITCFYVSTTSFIFCPFFCETKIKSYTISM